MGLPNWWEVATPRKDILAGRLSESVFATDLGDGGPGKGPIAVIVKTSSDTAGF